MQVLVVGAGVVGLAVALQFGLRDQPPAEVHCWLPQSVVVCLQIPNGGRGHEQIDPPLLGEPLAAPP